MRYDRKLNFSGVADWEEKDTYGAKLAGAPVGDGKTPGGLNSLWEDNWDDDDVADDFSVQLRSVGSRNSARRGSLSSARVRRTRRRSTCRRADRAQTETPIALELTRAVSHSHHTQRRACKAEPDAVVRPDAASASACGGAERRGEGVRNERVNEQAVYRLFQGLLSPLALFLRECSRLPVETRLSGGRLTQCHSFNSNPLPSLSLFPRKGTANEAENRDSPVHSRGPKPDGGCQETKARLGAALTTPQTYARRRASPSIGSLDQKS